MITAGTILFLMLAALALAASPLGRRGGAPEDDA